MTKLEKTLLSKLAASYAFIKALREHAIERVDPFVIRATIGIDKAISDLEVEYPIIFKRAFSKAKKKGDVIVKREAKEEKITELAPRKKPEGIKKEP